MNTKLTKQERDKLQETIKRVGYLHKYATDQLSDEALQSLVTPVAQEVLAVIKPCLTKQQNQQANKTALKNKEISELHAKLNAVATPEQLAKAARLDAEIDEMLSEENQGIFNFGKKVWNALHHSDATERRATLKKESLYHSDDYHELGQVAEYAIQTQQQKVTDLMTELQLRDDLTRLSS